MTEQRDEPLQEQVEEEDAAGAAQDAVQDQTDAPGGGLWRRPAPACRHRMTESEHRQSTHCRTDSPKSYRRAASHRAESANNIGCIRQLPHA